MSKVREDSEETVIVENEERKKEKLKYVQHEKSLYFSFKRGIEQIQKWGEMQQVVKTLLQLP